MEKIRRSERGSQITLEEFAAMTGINDEEEIQRSIRNLESRNMIVVDRTTKVPTYYVQTNDDLWIGE